MMPKYESQFDYHDAICPYCLYKLDGHELERSDFAEEIECDECGKFFVYEVEIHAAYNSYPSCKLNNENCVCSSENLKRPFPRCEICGERIRIDEFSQSVII